MTENGVIHIDFSDHATFFSKSNSFTKASAQMINYRNFKYFDEDEFLCDLFNIPFLNVFDYSIMDEKREFVVSSLQSLFIKHVPVKMSRVRKTKAPLHINVYSKTKNQRYRALKPYNESKLGVHLQYYRELCNYINKVVNNEKRHIFINNFSTTQLGKCGKH